MDETLGGVAAGDVDGVIELNARMNGPAAVHEFGLRVSRLFCTVLLLVLCLFLVIQVRT